MELCPEVVAAAREFFGVAAIEQHSRGARPRDAGGGTAARAHALRVHTRCAAEHVRDAARDSVDVMIVDLEGGGHEESEEGGARICAPPEFVLGPDFLQDAAAAVARGRGGVLALNCIATQDGCDEIEAAVLRGFAAWHDHDDRGAGTGEGEDPEAGPVQPKPFASRSVRRALLIPQANPGSLYRCGQSA